MALPKPVQSADMGKGAAESGKDEDIKEPHEHDVLCGRGGSINSWKGNERFRTLVEKRKRVYLTARFKREKRLIASSIVQEIQSLEPPGRFLSRNAKKGTWFVIDDEKARDKVSQALRENAPSIRAEIETEINEQRAEIQRSQHEPPPPPPPNAPPNPYYPQAPGWGYFSYYGYAQQPSHPGAIPPPPPHYHPGYSNPHWPHHPQPPPPPQSDPSRQPAANFPSSKATSSNPSPQLREPVHPQTQQPAQPQVQAVHVPPPDPPGPAPAPPPPPPKDEHSPQPQDDEKSVFSTASIMSVLPLSIASWTRDAFSIGGSFSITANIDDQQDSASVTSKPLRYVHQPEDNRSVASRGARSVRFKDERSISGRSLEPRIHPKPPRIMHSSQINYPRRPRRNSNGTPQRPAIANPNNPMAPVSSVHLNDHNDGMISLITTEGMNSIMEESAMTMDDFDHDLAKKHLDEFKNCEPEPLSLGRLNRSGRSPRRRNSTGKDGNSMFEAVANQIVMGMDTWDGNGVNCGPESTPSSIQSLSEMMAVEIEGQEVQLVDDMMEGQQDHGEDISVLEDRMPPHDKVRLQVDWPSRVGSCHSFFNDSLAGASFFSAGINSKGYADSPASSMDMDVSSGTDPFSVTGGSVGGASLCRVFDAEASSSQNISHNNLHNRMLAQMPSWERAMRSPMGSQDLDNDQVSYVTRNSEKLMGGSISTIGSIETNEKQNGAMAWENHNKE